MKIPALSRLVLPAIVALGAAGCGREPAPSAALPPVAVPVVEARLVRASRPVELPGTIRAVDQAVLAPKVMGTVETLAVRLGQPVRKGDILVKLTANEIVARMAQAEAGLAQARRDLEREQALVAKGAAAIENVRAMEDRLRVMEAMASEARTMLAYTAVTAPFDGVITRRFVNEGDLAAPGNPLLEMENPTVQRAEVEVPDGLATVAVGAPVVVRVGDLVLEGRVAEISPALDVLSRTYLAKVDLPAGAAVRSGQFARVAWPAGESEAIVVPAAAVGSFGQMEHVHVVQDGRVWMRLVKTGARRGETMEILAGLAAGERVAVGGPANLRDGQPVEVRP